MVVRLGRLMRAMAGSLCVPEPPGNYVNVNGSVYLAT